MRRVSLGLITALALLAAFACVSSESGQIDEKIIPIFGAQLPH